MRVSLHEAAERFGARADDGEAALHVVVPVERARFAHEQTFQTPGDGFNRRQRVVQFVAEHAHEPLPRLAFLFAQFAAEVGEDEQLMRQTAFAKDAAPQPATTRATGKVFGMICESSPPEKCKNLETGSSACDREVGLKVREQTLARTVDERRLSLRRRLRRPRQSRSSPAARARVFMRRFAARAKFLQAFTFQHHSPSAFASAPRARIA